MEGRYAQNKKFFNNCDPKQCGKEMNATYGIVDHTQQCIVMILKDRQEQHKLNSALMSAAWTTSTQENYITREPAL